MGAMTNVLGRRSWLLAGLVCAGLGASVMWAVQSGASSGGGSTPAALATNAHCGETVNASLTLNGDLTCSGTALIITKASVVLNLGGHHIAGNGTGNGVQISGKSDTVETGLITGFADGVYVLGTGSTDTVSAVRATHNTSFGIFDQGQGTKITNCVALANYIGMESAGDVAGTLSGDHELNNTYSGLELFVTEKLIVTGNIADGNGHYGIDDQGSGTTLTKNTANFNGGDGMNAASDVAVIDGAGNIAKGNDYASGATPEQCNGVVCS